MFIHIYKVFHLVMFNIHINKEHVIHMYLYLFKFI